MGNHGPNHRNCAQELDAMRGFSPEWLELREPADHYSINADVRQALADHVGERVPISVVDLGCGTGSNLRGLAPLLGRKQRWTLFDHDARLLATAVTRLRGWARSAVDAEQGLSLVRGETNIGVSFRNANLSTVDFARIIEGNNLVTAAALFDLVSFPFIERLGEAVAVSGQVFYTVLTYDGVAAWRPEHPADTAMRDAFNDHQRGDKGFGPAAGPAATEALAASFASHGYTVIRGKSPWVLDDSFAALRRELELSWAEAVRSTGLVPHRTVDEWLRYRLAVDSVVTIGHEDVLALPPK
jgi:SAM-dependent methyltransferase